MKYHFLPNINKTEIADNLVLKTRQIRWIKQAFKNEESGKPFFSTWTGDRGSGQTFARAVYYIEKLLSQIGVPIVVNDYHHHVNDVMQTATFTSRRNFDVIATAIMRMVNNCKSIFVLKNEDNRTVTLCPIGEASSYKLYVKQPDLSQKQTIIVSKFALNDIVCFALSNVGIIIGKIKTITIDNENNVTYSIEYYADKIRRTNAIADKNCYGISEITIDKYNELIARYEKFYEEA